MPTLFLQVYYLRTLSSHHQSKILGREGGYKTTYMAWFFSFFLFFFNVIFIIVKSSHHCASYHQLWVVGQDSKLGLQNSTVLATSIDYFMWVKVPFYNIYFHAFLHFLFEILILIIEWFKTFIVWFQEGRDHSILRT